jgi:hypothetical protein
MLSEFGPFPKSKIRAYGPLLLDFHQDANVKPVVPVVKDEMLMY